MGADLAYVGTRFVATAEARASDAYKEMIVASSAADIVYSDLFSGVHGNYLRGSIAASGLDPDNLPAGDKTHDEVRLRGQLQGEGVARHLGRGAGRGQHRRGGPRARRWSRSSRANTKRRGLDL